MTEVPPWSHLVAWSPADGKPRQLTLTADKGARARIARHLELDSLEQLELRLLVAPWMDGLEVTGRLEAAAGRTCGVSLEPFIESISEPVAARFLPPGSAHLPLTEPAEIVVDLEAEDPPEPGLRFGVDIGVFAIEILTLALDPFPRRPDAVFEAPATEPSASPFSVLAGLKRDNGES